MSPTSFSTRSALLLVAATVASVCALAQSYTAVDLTPNGSGVASAAGEGLAAGYTGAVPNAVVGRATLWTADGPIDLHPAFLNGAGARSTVNGFAAGLQVGFGADASTGNRNIPLAWRDTADSATALTIPFVNGGGQATATDGVQIVGSAIGLNGDGTALSSTHALIWDVATGTATDIGTDANLLGVAAGQQVGTVLRKVANATLWRGTKAGTSLHPKGAAISSANATDGVHQVGYAGFDIRVRVEAVKGQKNKRFNYAYVWNGTAVSGLNIHPYVSSADGSTFDSSYALSIAGDYIAGYATLSTSNTSIGRPRAIVWDSNFQATDLQAFVPPGFISSVAYAVDADGNVAGVMTKADGTRHAVIWVLNPAQ